MPWIRLVRLEWLLLFATCRVQEGHQLLSLTKEASRAAGGTWCTACQLLWGGEDTNGCVSSGVKTPTESHLAQSEGRPRCHLPAAPLLSRTAHFPDPFTAPHHEFACLNHFPT